MPDLTALEQTVKLQGEQIRYLRRVLEEHKIINPGREELIKALLEGNGKRVRELQLMGVRLKEEEKYQ